jgi:hypothetical protein
MTITLRRTLPLALAAALAAGGAQAQTAVTPRTLGMGGATVAAGRGYEALFLNPAGLGLAETPRWSAGVLQLSAGAELSGGALGDLPELADAGALSQARRDEILAGVPGGGMNAGVDVRIPLAAVQVNRVAVGVAWAGSYRQNLGRGLVDLVLNGYQTGRTDYSVGGTGGTRVSFVDVSAAYGRRLGPVSVGATAHYLAGGSLTRSRLFEPEFDLEAEDLSAEYREVYAEGGHGWSLDVGVAAQPAPGVTLSAAVANVAAGMTWSGALHTRHVVLRRADFEDGAVQDALSGLNESAEPVDPGAVPATVYETARGLYDEAYLPATLQAGASLALRGGRTVLAASYRDVLTSGRMGAGWERTAALGVEQRIPFATLRAGAATDLDGRAMLSGGLSLGPLELGIARTTGGAEGTEAGGWTASLGLSARSRATLPLSGSRFPQDDHRPRAPSPGRGADPHLHPH